jgi:ABC-2 type transport system permease protein
VTGHFLFFLLASTRNRLRVQLRRLRSPRYAVAALVGFLYFAFLFGGWQGPPTGDEPAVGALNVDMARHAGPLFIALLAAWWWLWGGYRHGLTLTPAETHLLVTAPLTRRELVRFRILQAQAPILMSALLATLLTRYSGIPWPLRLLSFHLLLATLHMHQIAASLVHAAAAERGRTGVRRVWPALVIFTAALAGVAWSVWHAARDVVAGGLASLGPRLLELSAEPVYRAALAPFRLLLEPITAPTTGAWPPRFAAALALLAAHYWWVQRTDAAFEEMAAERGAAQNAREAALQAGGAARVIFAGGRRGRLARPLLPLAPTGPPAWALYWKNVLYTQRILRPALLVAAALLLAPLLVLGIIVQGQPGLLLRGTGFLLVGLAGLATVAGPLAVRNDLRLDLENLASLRTLPLRGAGVVAAEVAACATVVALLLLGTGLAGVLLLVLAGTLPAPLAIALAAGGILVALPLATLNAAIQNALALLYPGWISIGREAGGVEAFGQNIVTLVGTLLLMLLALVPPLLVAAIAGAILMPLSSTGAVAAGVLVLSAALAAETALLVLWLGRLFERTDPVAAGLL